MEGPGIRTKGALLTYTSFPDVEAHTVNYGIESDFIGESSAFRRTSPDSTTEFAQGTGTRTGTHKRCPIPYERP